LYRGDITLAYRQEPPLHVPLSQTLSHCPQFRASVLVSTQLDPHLLMPVSQLALQLPKTHQPPLQEMPQPPQL
jgi:hypothetical protein